MIFFDCFFVIPGQAEEEDMLRVCRTLSLWTFAIIAINPLISNRQYASIESASGHHLEKKKGSRP